MMYLSSGKERPVVLALYIIENNATVRATASRFGISKSTVHKDVTQTLKNINRSLYIDVKSILEKNKKERPIRGGEATKQKYRVESNITSKWARKLLNPFSCYFKCLFNAPNYTKFWFCIIWCLDVTSALLHIFA